MGETLVLRKKAVKRMYQLTREETLEERIKHLVTLSMGSCKMGNPNNQFSQELNKLCIELSCKGMSSRKIMALVGKAANKYKLGEESYRITHKASI